MGGSVLWEMSEFLILVILVALYWLATEVGYQLGRKHAPKIANLDKSHVGTLQGAILGMLALLLGFSFAMAVSRYDARKALQLREVNAIGTTYLRADFLPEEQRQQAKKLLRAYVDARLLFGNDNIGAEQVNQYYNAALALHAQLWPIATTAASQSPLSEPVGLFIASLNEVIDLAELRRGAFSNHLPEAIVGLLVLVSCGALGFIGFGCGQVGHRRIPSTITYVVLSVMVLVTILDLDRPRQGLILVKQDAMIRLQTNLNKDVP
jgi:hypothetical protein